MLTERCSLKGAAPKFLSYHHVQMINKTVFLEQYRSKLT